MIMKQLLLIKIILIVSSAWLVACGKDTSAVVDKPVSPTDINDPAPKVCVSPLQAVWISPGRLEHEFNSNCTGKIPSCGVEFTYELGSSNDSDGGTIYAHVTKSDNVPSSVMPNCPQLDDEISCGFAYDYHAQSIVGMYINCGDATEYFDRNRGAE